MKKVWLMAALALTACVGDDDDDATGIRGQIGAGVSIYDGFTDFDASAVWVNVTIPIDLSPIDLPDGGCMSVATGAPVGNVVPVDAGTSLLMDGPNGDMTLAQDFFPGFYTASTSGTGLYVPGGNYTFSGTGGAVVGAFSQTLTAPSTLTVTSPDMSSGVTITKSADITVTWTSAGGSDPVFVSLSQDNFDTDVTVAAIVCRFDDDGSGTIPASELSAFQLSASDPNLDAGFSVEKTTFTTFTVPGAGNTLGTMSYGWSAAADIQ